MARDLGMNPKKLGNHDQEPCKAPLPQFIEHLYFERFVRERPEVVMSMEERARAQHAKKAAQKEAKRRARAEGGDLLPEEGTTSRATRTPGWRSTSTPSSTSRTGEPTS